MHHSFTIILYIQRLVKSRKFNDFLKVSDYKSIYRLAISVFIILFIRNNHYDRNTIINSNFITKEIQENGTYEKLVYFNLVACLIGTLAETVFHVALKFQNK